MDEFMKKINLSLLTRTFFPGMFVIFVLFIDNLYLGLFETNNWNINSVIGSINILLLLYLFGSLIYIIHRSTIGEFIIYHIQLCVSHIIGFSFKTYRKLPDTNFFINKGYRFYDVRSLYIYIRDYLHCFAKEADNSYLQANANNNQNISISAICNNVVSANVDIEKTKTKMIMQFERTNETRHTNLHVYWIAAEVLIINTFFLFAMNNKLITQIRWSGFLGLIMFCFALFADIKQHFFEIRFLSLILNSDKNNKYFISEISDFVFQSGFISAESNDKETQLANKWMIFVFIVLALLMLYFIIALLLVDLLWLFHLSCTFC